MMKSNSLTNRILALALTLVMVLGMMPSGLVTAEETDTTTIYFDPLDEWVAAGHTYSLYYAPGAGNYIYLDVLDSDGDGIYEVAVDTAVTSRMIYFVYESGKSGWDCLYYDDFYVPDNGSNNLYTVTSYNSDGTMNGTWSVYTPAVTPPAEPEVTYVAEVNGTQYETLAAAVAAAEPGATVTLLGNASGAGVVIDKDITIDFGGFTYTFTEGVGSTGTESNGFQILSGNTVTLKNGKLNVAEADKSEFYMLIQNYANLTVTDMTLDGTNLDKYSGTDGDSYALSNNSGSVTINGNTNIIANNEGALAYAFDVCKYQSYPAPTVTVNTTGKVTGNVQVSEGLEKNLTIENGTFTDKSVAPYVAEDKKLNESGTVVSKTYVAETGGKKFETLAAAVAVAEPGATVTLLGSASGAGVVINKDITIDFGYSTYTLTEPVGSTGTESNGLQILQGNNVTLKNGTLNVAEANKSEFYMLIQNYANLTVSGMTLDGTNLDKWSATDGDSYALSINSGNVTIENSTIIANNDGDKAFAFDVCQYQSYAAPTVTVKSGTVKGAVNVSAIGNSTFAIEGGQFQDASLIDYVVYGKTMDETGMVITDTVIDTERELRDAIAKGGEVTLGGNISLTAPITVDKAVTLNLNTFTLTLPEHNNYAIVVKDSLTVNGEGNVVVKGLYGIGLSTACTGGLTVNGGNITGANADYLIGAFNGKVTINGGNLTANYCVLNSFDGYNATAEVKGGTLTAEYPVLGVNVAVADAAKLNIGGFLCVNGDTYYNDLATAIADAASGDTIKLLTNGSGAGAVIDKNVTVDFSGFTYTFTEGMGSTGTESNGLQILQGNNVTLKNGTLKVAAESADKFYMLVQNYANLTVTNMTLDGTNLDKWSGSDGDSYALSINSGKVTIENTTIIANDQGAKAFAFDVCQYGNYAVPNVTVLSGDFRGNVDTSAIGAASFAISGGTFTSDISDYVVEGKTAVYEDGKYIVRLNQTGFGFLKFDEVIAYAEGLTYTNAVVGGQVESDAVYTVIEGADIATVDANGVLTITGDGTIIVKAEKPGNETYAPVSAAYTLTVTKGASSITTESTHVDLTFGVDSYKMPVATVGDGTVSYAISDTNVAVTLNPTTGELTFDDTVDQVGSFTVTISMAEGDNYFAAEDVTYTVTVNYAETPDVPFTLSPAAPNAKGWYNETVYLAPAEGYQFCLQVVDTVSTWMANGIEYTDGVYENIVIYLKDTQGNITAPIEVGTLKIDSVKPNVAMEIVNAVWKTISEKIFFITNEDVTVKVTVSDATSGIEDIQISIDSGVTFNPLDITAGEYLITLSAEYRDFVEVQVVDKSGLENRVKSEGTIIIDAVDPVIKAEFTGIDVTSNDIYFTDGVDFSVKYSVTENNLDLHDKNLVVTINGETQTGWTLSDAGIVEKLLTGEGVYEINATFTDIANNAPATLTYNYVIDTAAPTITLTPGETTVINGVHYTTDTNYSVVITINEELYGTYLNHGVKPVVTVNGEVETLNWATNTATLKLPANGVYEVEVTYDNLVHEAVTETITIVVDAEKPVITLTPNTELDVDGIYYTAKENYGLEITLDADLYSYYYDLGFKPVVTVNGDEKDLNWSEPKETLELPDNGVYEIVVSYSNCWQQAADKSVTIVVDHEEPVITLTPDIDLVKNDVYYTAQENYGLKISLNEDLYNHYLACGTEPVVTVNGKETKLDWLKPETVLTLAENGVYEVVVNYENYLHKAEQKSITIVVDHEVPVITLTPDIDLVENNVYYTAKESYGLKISLNEDLYDHYLACVLEPVVTVNGKETELDWHKPETVLTLAENGVYEIVVNYENYLHKAEQKTITIVVDHEVPVIELLHGIEDPDLLVDGTYYTDDEKYALTINQTEDLYDYYLTCGIAPVVTVNGAETTLDWNHTKDDAVLEAILPLTEDGVYEITVSYGHYLHKAETKSITICKDTVDPEVTITYRDAEGKDVVSEIVNKVGETVFADAVTAVITVTDVNFDKRNEFVELSVTPSNKVEEKNTYNGKMDATWTKVEGKEHTWECVLPLTQDADYVIEFNCQDYANNSNSASAKLAVDIDEVPDNFKFGYSYSVHGEILETITLGFWRNQLTVTVDVVDDISGIEYFEASYSVAEDAYQNGNAAGSFGRDELDVVSHEKLEILDAEKITNGYRVTFLVPKEMLTKDNQVNGYITLTATDYAGNSTTVTDGVRMIVDNIDPTRTVELTVPVNETETVKYYDGTITLKANIFEANYHFYENAVVSIMKDGKAYAHAGHVSGWYNAAGSPNATNTITLTEDGDYVVTITYTDGSGNKMADYSSGNLTLDTVAPVITVSNIKQNSANKDETYGFTITVNDINLDTATVQAKLTAVVQGENGLYSTKEISLGDPQVSADGTTVTYTVENLDEDALYTLTCSAEDMSNNLCSEIQLADGETYETVNFSINRNGSTFGFGSDYMSELVNQYFVYSVYEDLVIEEVNVDPIENYTITVNGNVLVEGTDFTTEQTSNDGEWSKRTYVINKTLFAEEGEYNVVVSSVDKAETTAYSDIKNLAIAFVVDQTAPILTISGLQAGGRYQTEEQTVTLIPTDEGGRLNTLKVVVLDANGNPLTDDNGNDISVRFEYAGEELLNYLAENGDMVTFTIPSGLEHQVQISCTDCAVNEYGTTNEYNGMFSRVTVSQNALVIFYANKSLFFGTLGGLAALIILIAVLLKKKSGKK